MRTFARVLIFLLALVALGWCALVLAYTIPGPPLLGQILAVAAVLAGVLGFRVLGSFSRGAALVAAIFVGVLLWYFSLQPKQDAAWQPDVAELPRVEIDGDRLTIHNVRNFDYRSETDFTPRWETRTYDLSKLDGVDMFFSHWSGPAIAHTIMSWSFSDGQHLAISIETRKVEGQEYSAVAGFFRQYPIYYVVADERDVVRVRTNYRGENVWMYRLKPPRPEAARAAARLRREHQRARRTARVVQRAHRQLHDVDPAPCTAPQPGREPVRLAAAGERPSAGAAVRAGPDRYEPAVRGTRAPQPHRRTRQGRRSGSRVLRAHP